MSRALEGIVVVTLEQAVAAPLATSRLADAGARVIKLERPEGDFARDYDTYALGQSSYFVWNNRGKESCVVDLKTPDDLALVEAMIAQADVFVQNLAPGATGRLGLASADLRRRHPRLIVCDIGGYAAETPDRTRKAYDLLIQAEAGLSSITGTADSGPSRVGVSICDIATGQAAYAAIVEALFRRERTGQGAHLQLSLFDTMAEFMNVPYLSRRYGDREPKRIGLAHPSIAPYGAFRTTDGEIVVSIQNDREWQTFCSDILGRPDLRTDPLYARNVDRVNNRDRLDPLVQGVVGTMDSASFCARLDAAKIAYGRVSTMQDLIDHRSASFATVETEAGRVDLLAPPVVVDGARPSLGAVPRLGAHSATLREEFAPDAQRRNATR